MDAMLDPIRKRLTEALHAASEGEDHEARMALFEAMALMDSHVPAS